jgi:preprotein translocase subunit YajC
MTTLLHTSTFLALSLIGQTEGEVANPFGGIWMMVVIIAIFWFLLIAPQRKEQKEKETMRESLKKGDEVVTSGGIHGQIVGVETTTAIVRIAPKVEVIFEKVAIAHRVKKAASDEANK